MVVGVVQKIFGGMVHRLVQILLLVVFSTLLMRIVEGLLLLLLLLLLMHVRVKLHHILLGKFSFFGVGGRLHLLAVWLDRLLTLLLLLMAFGRPG